MSRPLITLTTDFGTDSLYVAQMKGAILSVNREVDVFDVTHSIRPQDVLHGAIVLADTWHCFPSGTIHVAVIDPGVGTDRELVCVHLDDSYFVLPDNGLLTGVLQTHSARKIIRLSNNRYHRDQVSSTFHGRDIMGPVAAHLSLGVAIDDLGEVRTELARIDLPQPTVSHDQISGQVILVDSFGNLITNIRSPLLTRPDAEVWLGDRRIGPPVATYAEGTPGQPVALVGSSDRLEICCRQRRRQASPTRQHRHRDSRHLVKPQSAAYSSVRDDGDLMKEVRHLWFA